MSDTKAKTAKLSANAARVLRGFSRENDGAFRCNKAQANELAKAIQEVLKLVAIEEEAL